MSVPPQLFTNNGVSSLSGGIAAGDLSLVVQAGHGARFPAPGGSDYFLLTIFQRSGAAEINHEIVKCTNRTVDTLTIVRAQDGTSALAFNNSDPVELRWTKAAAALFAPLDSPTFTTVANFSHHLLAANGTVGVPSYSFTNSATSGLYQVSANNIGMSVAGVLATQWGTLITDKIAHVVDCTGIQFRGLNSGTSDRFRITASGPGAGLGVTFDATNAGETAYADLSVSGAVLYLAADPLNTGTGSLQFMVGNIRQAEITRTAGANTYCRLTGSNGGSDVTGPTLSVQGSATDAALVVQLKGTGYFYCNHPARFAKGTASAPGYSFTDDETCGWYFALATSDIVGVAGTVESLRVQWNTGSGGVKITNRLTMSGQNSTASANNLALGYAGNRTQITGAVQINLIDATDWAGGSIVYLHFVSTPTVKHNQGVSGVNKPIMLAGAADFVATANDQLMLQYDSIDSKWYEISRTVI